MPVINGIYLKDFPTLGRSPLTTDLIPIGYSSDNVAYKATLAQLLALGSVGLTMPSAFSVANSPVQGTGTLAVTAAGVASQYIRGDGTLSDFPTNSGGGSSVSYYLNGSVSQGTISGNAYKEMNKTPVIGTGTDFTIGADGYIAQFITDANDPASLLIPGGNWNVEMYFSASSSGGTPSFYVELYKYDGATFTLLGSSATTPEGITNGTAIDIYYTSLAVPETVLTLTDRLAIRVYVTASGRTITLHTEDNHLSEIITTFSNGLTALNGLTKQVQYFAVGSTGTDFAISSSVDTHTFNLPSASATARGLVTTGTQTFAGAKTLTSTLTATAATFSSIIPLVFSSATNIDFHQLNSGTIRFIDNTAVSVNLSVTNSGDLATRGTATIGSIGALGSSATTFLTNTAGLIQSRTAAEVRSDIGAGTGSGTVTSVAAITLGTTGTDLSSTVANGTTTPVITLNVPDASATARGVVTTGTQTFGGNKTLSGTFTTASSGIDRLTLSANFGENGLKALVSSESLYLAATGGSIYVKPTEGTPSSYTTFAANGNVTIASLTNGLVKSTSGVLSNATANTDYLPVASPTFTGTITGGAFSGTSATFSGNVIFDTTDRGIVSNTTDGSDNKFVFINGGGARGSDRGAGVNFFGNEATGTGRIDMQAGDVTGGVINLITQGLNRLTVNRDGTTTLTQALSGTSATFSGAVSKGSGSFRIPHPLASLSDTHQLVHSFIEGPQADLIYRGRLTLENGKAQANIDEVSAMTKGTFEVLCREVQCFTTNESGWDLVKGKVIGNIIYIESKNENSIDEISWMVIGERQDKHMMETEWTDENGKVIVEPLKPIEFIVNERIADESIVEQPIDEIEL